MLLLPRPRSLERLAGSHRPSSPEGPEPVLRIDPTRFAEPQGYRLLVERERVLIEARDAAGAFHARQTLKQLARLADGDGSIPGVRIEDWPDLPVRGVLLDISRDKVPTMETLYGYVESLAEWKINQLQLYVEHTFAYRRHREVWQDASPMTHEEFRALDAFCRERFIELVPNQNSFGHMERWLKHPRYAPLAEIGPGEEAPPAAVATGYRSLNPVDERSIELLAELYAELLPCFASRQLNVGCDETLDLGLGGSRAACAARGVGRVYLDFLLRIHELVSRHGHTMQFWGDIILNHPELIGELPRDVVALDWGYEADHPFAAEGRRFAESGIRHLVCPGTSSWLSLAGRTDNALANLRNAIDGAARRGAAGCLVTDWGDCGHWQPLPVSLAPLAYGAALGWAAAANRDLDLAAALDLHVFRDRAGVIGRAALDLGNAYRVPGITLKNASVLAHLLLFPRRPLNEGRWAALTAESLERAEGFVDDAVSKLRRADLAREDAPLVMRELILAADLMRHACRLGRARLSADGHEISRIPGANRRALSEELARLIAEYRGIWLERNRPGGLADSAGRLERLLAEY